MKLVVCWGLSKGKRKIFVLDSVFLLVELKGEMEDLCDLQVTNESTKGS